MCTSPKTPRRHGVAVGWISVRQDADDLPVPLSHEHSGLPWESGCIHAAETLRRPVARAYYDLNGREIDERIGQYPHGGVPVFEVVEKNDPFVEA